MTNPFYNVSGTPGAGSFGASAAIRAEFAAIQAGFNLLPALTAGTAVVVDPSGSFLTNTVGTLALAGNFALTGNFNTTLAQQATTTLTLPSANDTLIGRATTDTLTNKTISGASNTLTNIGNSSLTNSSITLGSTTMALGSSNSTIAGAITWSGSQTFSSALTYGGVTLSNAVTGTGSMVLSTSPSLTTPNIGTPSAGTLTNCSGLPVSSGISGLGTGVATLLAATPSGSGGLIGKTSPTISGLTTTGTLATANQTITSTSANALAVGANGTTNPVLNVDASTASVATGLNIKGAAAAAGVALSVLSSGTNENLTIDAKGSGTITLGGTSTGGITLTRATTLSAALTYGGVTLSNSVTGTGSMVLSASPTLTGTLIGPDSATWSSTGISGLVKLGIGMAPTNILDITQSQNAGSQVAILNSNAGTSAYSSFTAKNGTSTVQFGMLSTGYTTNGALVTGYGYVQSASGLSLISGASSPILFGINNVEKARFDTSGNLLIGTTTNPSSYALNVNGSVNFGGNAVIGNNLTVNGSISVTQTGSPSNIAAGGMSATVDGFTSTGFGFTSNLSYSSFSTSYSFTVQAGGSGGVLLNQGATSWTSASRRGLKAQLQPIKDAVATLKKIPGYTGVYKSDPHAKVQPFFLYEDAAENFEPMTTIRAAHTLRGTHPETGENVVVDVPEHAGIMYDRAAPLLAAAILEIVARLEKLEGR